jgi:hypothetical protein
MEAKIGAKNMVMRKQMPQVMAVSPVLPPSAMPAPDSMTVEDTVSKEYGLQPASIHLQAVTGDTPNSAPMEMQIASVQ